MHRAYRALPLLTSIVQSASNHMKMSKLMYSLLYLYFVVTAANCDPIVSNTTMAATNIESTIGTPAILVDPTSFINQNSTDSQYETILRITPFSNSTSDSNEATTFHSMTVDEDIDFTKLIENFQQNKSSAATLKQQGNVDYDDKTPGQALAKQLGLPAQTLGFLANRAPCECKNGICGCCTGMLFSALRQLGCLNITYSPEDFSFEFKMIMNNAVLYKNRVTGRNPPPVCVRMPRFTFIKVCASFYDLYFVGRNMHVCLEMLAYFQDNEIFNRSFDCMRIGDKGVKIVKPEDGGGLFHKPGTDADIDAGFDDIEDYDENAVVRRRKSTGL